MPPSTPRTSKPCSNQKTQQKAEKFFMQKIVKLSKGLITGAKITSCAYAFMFLMVTLNVLFFSLYNWYNPLDYYMKVWEVISSLGWNRFLAVTLAGLFSGTIIYFLNTPSFKKLATAKPSIK